MSIGPINSGCSRVDFLIRDKIFVTSHCQMKIGQIELFVNTYHTVQRNVTCETNRVISAAARQCKEISEGCRPVGHTRPAEKYFVAFLYAVSVCGLQYLFCLDLVSHVSFCHMSLLLSFVNNLSCVTWSVQFVIGLSHCCGKFVWFGRHTLFADCDWSRSLVLCCVFIF